LNVKLVDVTGPTQLPDGDEIIALTYAGDTGVEGANPILISISVNPNQTDPEAAVEALREAAGQLADSIDQFNDFVAAGGLQAADAPNQRQVAASQAAQFAGDFL
jgi:hypothetical protein